MTLQRRRPLRSRRVWTANENGSHRPMGGPQWRKERERCRDRAGGRCQAGIPDVCEGRGIHAHHLRRRSQGGQDELDNLAWLCGSCHGYVHERISQALDMGLLRARRDPGPYVWTPDAGVTAAEAWRERNPL